MPNCPFCHLNLRDRDMTCPNCFTDVSAVYEEKRDDPFQSLDTSAVPPENYEEIGRLMVRGKECYERGAYWLSMKDHKRARTEFQRAMRLFDKALQLDSRHPEARAYRERCLARII